MSSIVLTRHIGYLRSILPASRLAYHAGKAASVNTAIARGIRKSKKFPGSEGRPGDARQPYIERNGLRPRDRELDRGSREDRPSRAISADEKRAPRKAPWEQRGSQKGKQGHPRTPFDNSGSFGSPVRQADRNSFESRDTPKFNPRHPHHFHDPQPRESFAKSYGERRRNGSSFQHASSDGDSTSPKRKWERPMKIVKGRGPFKSGENSLGNSDSSYQKRQWEPRPESRSRFKSGDNSLGNSDSAYQKRQWEPRPESRSRFKSGEASLRNGDSTYQKRQVGLSDKLSVFFDKNIFNKPWEPRPMEIAEGRGRFKSGEASLRNGDSTYQKRQWEPMPMEIAEGRGRFKSGEDSLGNGESTSNISRHRGPKGRSFLTEGLEGDGAPSMDAGVRSYKQNNPAARRGSDHNDSSEDGNRFSMTPRFETGPRTVKSGPQIPLSIPYTTPASEFLYGTSVVEAALTSRRIPRRQLYKLYIYTGENREQSSSDRDVDLEALARTNGVKVSRVHGGGLALMDKMSGGRPHNGYILEASPLPRLPITSLGSIVDEDGRRGFNVTVDFQSREDAAVNGTADFINLPRSRRQPMVLLLDSIQDPGNLGGIIRTASFLGASAVAISIRNSASFTPVVLKASAGASENITLFSISNPEAFIQASHEAGWKTYAAVAPAGKVDRQANKTVSTDELDDPLARNPCLLMLGGEGDGLRTKLKKKSDIRIYIPGRSQKSSVDSLNVSVAAGILCNAFLGRNRPAITPPVDKVDGDVEEARGKNPDDLF
ncbi:hypothetical protein HYFRA_00003329 [Hymenoscyphus fraxineus]|uniref:rRNA methyltransferase 1, mitochondrial n=1 Tax=Hymenoscyphus fraxineus TaxID=746836 RepID=A0A9N9KU59_9HELO|nr:hypothetical protein HYFRA_00003329 [Hymenoscyphus fraxineus]